MPRPGLAPKEDEPETPTDLDLRDLPRAVRAELRGLTPELAQVVGSHLLMAGQLIETDPKLAYAHAEAARRRAARLSITREATGEAAYAAGEYQVALHEFRALRRMNGGTEFLAAMADCERALGRPDKALKLIREGLDAQPDFNQRVELRLVEAGCRVDLRQTPEALRLLKNEIEASAGRGSRGARARLRYGYADLLERTGDAESAEKWFAAAAALDTDGETDADDRVAALRGLVLEVDEDALVGEPEPVEEIEEAVQADAEPAAAEVDGAAPPDADEPEEDPRDEQASEKDGEDAR
ncbi:tetratricopeptide repeat protein [Propioniciclava sinopodophylli]|uniref:Tetratricopeptide repeat protein n=1 Tax=Propioniciclava sinopodophylli TaxID=1837344 RepID=A0A4V2JSG8_9ACTN|nr:tetratricopeptide repeat protein [Propioniciclava sinopodophylli]TBT84719.1 tetratricopeptide repeat protein [Propioniciclava sinopodophylli]